MERRDILKTGLLTSIGLAAGATIPKVAAAETGKAGVQARRDSCDGWRRVLPRREGQHG
ncbi:UNVERIFIED_ORG: hypothetical protein M2438_005006 [Methylobacterium sp. SuP10 SLI 274]|nr:hypothetical protein [Methylobacterium sp. SuP10 SLI 274]